MNVKKGLIYTLILFIGLSQTELHELLKLPALIRHYQEHLVQEPDLGFVEFLQEHYGDSQQHADRSSHNDGLPFKDTSCNSTLIVCGLLPTSNEDVLFERFELAVFPMSKNDVFFSRACADIWQPPKMML